MAMFVRGLLLVLALPTISALSACDTRFRAVDSTFLDRGTGPNETVRGVRVFRPTDR